jgi:hypothetical protein
VGDIDGSTEFVDDNVGVFGGSITVPEFCTWILRENLGKIPAFLPCQFGLSSSGGSPVNKYCAGDRFDLDVVLGDSLKGVVASDSIQSLVYELRSTTFR